MEDERRRLIPLMVIGGTLAAVYIGFYPFASVVLHKHSLPFVPANPRQIRRVLGLMKRRGPLLDIGSGDGRVVIAAAKEQERRGVGVEINIWLVLWARLQALRHGVSKRTSFIKTDLWKYDIRGYKTIVVFGVPEMMDDLTDKLIREMDQDAEVIACRFPLAHKWKPAEALPDSAGTQGLHGVWRYVSKRPDMFAKTAKGTQEDRDQSEGRRSV